MNIFLNQIAVASDIQYRGTTFNTGVLFSWLGLAPCREKRYANEVSLFRAFSAIKGEFKLPGVEGSSAYQGGVTVRVRDNQDAFYFAMSGILLRIQDDFKSAKLISPSTKLATNGEDIESNVTSKLLTLYAANNMDSGKEVAEEKLIDITEPETYSYESKVVFQGEVKTLGYVVDRLKGMASTRLFTPKLPEGGVVACANKMLDYSESRVDKRFIWSLLTTDNRGVEMLIALDMKQSLPLMFIRLDDKEATFTQLTYMSIANRKAIFDFSAASMTKFAEYDRSVNANEQEEVPARPEAERGTRVYGDKDAVLKLLCDAIDAVKLADEDFTHNDIVSILRKVDRVTDEIEDISNRRNQLKAFEKRRAERASEIAGGGLSSYLREDKQALWEQRQAEYRGDDRTRSHDRRRRGGDDRRDERRRRFR